MSNNLKKWTLGFSPCPNDTFIFDALVHRKIDTGRHRFEVVMEDVEALNKRAFAGELDLTKLSYHAFAHVRDQYVLLHSGSALGRHCGPLLISEKPYPPEPETVRELYIAIPGQYTTANFLLSVAFPEARRKTPMLFSEIEAAVLNGKVDAGLIIHENRFTYAQKGLQKIMDLGAYWESETGLPIPLGGIAVHRKHKTAEQQEVNALVRNSVQYALDNPAASHDYVTAHAAEMEPEVMQQHIDLYVNDFTVDLGTAGRKAVQALFDRATRLGVIPRITGKLFV